MGANIFRRGSWYSILILPELMPSIEEEIKAPADMDGNTFINYCVMKSIEIYKAIHFDDMSREISVMINRIEKPWWWTQ